MFIPCSQKIDCECDPLPLSNYSSEAPDRILYLSTHYGYSQPPPVNISPQNDGCTNFSASPTSQQDADECAAASNQECQTGQSLANPCDVCSGGTNSTIGLSFGLGYASISPTDSQDPCCDPDAPEGCCCNNTPGDPNPEPPDPSPNPPGQPPSNPDTPGNPPRTYCNTPQSCTVTCDNGAQYTATVEAGRFCSISPTMANQMAHDAACRQAEQMKECGGGGGVGCNCVVLCLDSPADFQIGTAPEEGEEKTFELVGGDMPNGVSMDSSGKITGTPDMAGNGSIDVKITNSEGKSVILHTCILVMGITNNSLPDGEVGSAYSAQLVAAGGEQPYTFACEADLPTGLSVNPTTGQITGTPDTGGNYSPIFRVTDACGASCAVQIELFIDGVSATIPRIYCPTNPAIYVDVNVTAWAPPGTDYETVKQTARSQAQSQSAQQLLDAGCGCVITGSHQLAGNKGVNGLVTDMSGVCNIPCWVYIDSACTSLFGPHNTINLNQQGINSFDWHFINSCVFSNDCANPFVCWVVPQAVPPATPNYPNYVVAHYRHVCHTPAGCVGPWTPSINCASPPHGGY